MRPHGGAGGDFSEVLEAERLRCQCPSLLQDGGNIERGGTGRVESGWWWLLVAEDEDMQININKQTQRRLCLTRVSTRLADKLGSALE